MLSYRRRYRLPISSSKNHVIKPSDETVCRRFFTHTWKKHINHVLCAFSWVFSCVCNFEHLWCLHSFKRSIYFPVPYMPDTQVDSRVVVIWMFWDLTLKIYEQIYILDLVHSGMRTWCINVSNECRILNHKFFTRRYCKYILHYKGAICKKFIFEYLLISV